MIKWIKAKFKTECFTCNAVINVGDGMLWSTKGKKALCSKCGYKFIEWKGGSL